MAAWWVGVWISGVAWGADLGGWSMTRPDPQPVPIEATGYRFSGDLFTRIHAAVVASEAEVVVESIGETLRGEPIWAFHVQRRDTEPAHTALVFGGIHALEWISTEVATDLLLELLAAPPPDTRVTVIPLLNPDGRAKVETDLLKGDNAYRRGNAANVDLNRDFATHREARAIWRHIIPGYYSHSESPLSQPESRALDALVAREHYDRAASLHAFGGYHYFPWAGRFERPGDWAEFVAIGRNMERAQGSHAYRTRQLGRWGFFFRAQGAELDHLYAQHSTRAFLIELTRSGFDLRRPRHSLNTYFRWYNPKNAARHRRKGLAAVRSLVRDW